MQYIESKSAPAAIGPYSQAIQAGGFLYTSGQIPLDPATGTVVGTTIEEQTERVIANLAAVLTAAGTSFEKVIKTTCFVKDMGDFAAFNGVYAKYFTGKPARSCVEVARLPKDVRVEIELVALV